MMKLAWTTTWYGRWSARSSDEYYRPTLVIPWLTAAGHDEEDGEPFRKALVLVIGPWWSTAAFWDQQVRDWVRWSRDSTLDQYAALELDEILGDDCETRWSLAYDFWNSRRPPFPERWD